MFSMIILNYGFQGGKSSHIVSRVKLSIWFVIDVALEQLAEVVCVSFSSVQLLLLPPLLLLFGKKPLSIARMCSICMNYLELFQMRDLSIVPYLYIWSFNHFYITMNSWLLTLYFGSESKLSFIHFDQIVLVLAIKSSCSFLMGLFDISPLLFF